MSYQLQGEPEEITVLKLRPTPKSKKGCELNAKSFDDDEREAFFKSDADQWQKHMDQKAVSIVPPDQAAKDPKHLILPIASRFVRTDKGEKGVLKAASRLVVPGHLQYGSPQEEGDERTDAPTVPQLGLHLLMTIAASFHWIRRMFDVSSAFLRGDAMDAEVYFRLPREGLPRVPEGSLIKAIEGVFGLRVAPRLWCKKVKAVLEDAGWTQLASLPGVFVLRIGKILMSILVLHVDDALHAGKGEEYEKTMDQIFKTFDSKEDKQKEGNFSFLGHQVAQQPDGTVLVTMQTYLDEVKPIFITRTRRSTNDSTVTGAEKTELMSLVGQLAWVARESLPQIAFDFSDLQQRFNVATVTELVRANTVLRQAKKLVLTNVLEFAPINLDKATFISVMDASFAGLITDGSSGPHVHGQDPRGLRHRERDRVALEEDSHSQGCEIDPCRRGSRDELRVRQDILCQGSLHRDHVRTRSEVARRAPNHSTGSPTHGRVWTHAGPLLPRRDGHGLPVILRRLHPTDIDADREASHS